MKQILFFTLLVTSYGALAGNGPTNLGNVNIGMSKADYISTIGIKPVNCNTYKDRNGKPQISEMKYLRADKKSLCWGFGFKETGSIENVNVSGLSYDVIEADSKSSIGGASKYLEAFGHSSKAIFLNDRLISIQISFPNVGVETLTAKYGPPKLEDNRSVEVCENRLGNEFNNKVGNLDAVWVNGKVQAILRAATSSPNRTCTDGLTMKYYILQEPDQLTLIENAINKYLKEISKEAIQDNPF